LNLTLSTYGLIISDCCNYDLLTSFLPSLLPSFLGHTIGLSDNYFSNIL
jgi:hypothetical protein